MVDFSSGLEILAEIKRKSENKGLTQASRLSPRLCRRNFPLACLKRGHQVWAPPWPSCQRWAGVRSQQENLLLRPKLGGLLAASRPGSKTSASSRVCNLRPAWDLLVSCQLRAWFLSGRPEHTPSSGNGPRHRNSLFLCVSTWHLTWRGARAARVAASPWFKDNVGICAEHYVSAQQCHYNKGPGDVWKLFPLQKQSMDSEATAYSDSSSRIILLKNMFSL